MMTVTVTVCVFLIGGLFGVFATRRYYNDFAKNREMYRNKQGEYQAWTAEALDEYEKARAEINANLEAGHKQIEQQAETLKSLKKELLDTQKLEAQAAERLKMCNTNPYEMSSKEYRKG